MDPARHRVTWAGRDVALTVTEFMILEALAQRPGFVKSRDQLMDAAYQDDVYVDDRTIDSHIKRLRRKFRSVDQSFKAIETIYGVCYRFSEESRRPFVEVVRAVGAEHPNPCGEPQTRRAADREKRG